MLRAIRVSLVVQALGLIALLGTFLPSFIDRVTRAPVDCPPGEACFDPTGTGFVIYALIFVPVATFLVVTAKLWQTDVRWPAFAPIAIDLLLLRAAISDLLSTAQPTEVTATPVAELVLLVVPALVSLGLLVTFVGLLTWRHTHAEFVSERVS